MATSRDRLTSAISDDTSTFQFTFSVPVPKFNPNHYHSRPEKHEPSSDNSTPDSTSSHLLFSLLPDSHDGEGSDESDDDYHRDLKYNAGESPVHHDAASHPHATASKEAEPEEKAVVRKLRTRDIGVTDEDSSNQTQTEKAPRKRSPSQPLADPRQRKRLRRTKNDSVGTKLVDSGDEEHEEQNYEKDADKKTKDTQQLNNPPTRRSWQSKRAGDSDIPDSKVVKDRFSFTKMDKSDIQQRNQSVHSKYQFSAEDAHLEFRSGYEYFVGVSEDENDDDGYHASDEEVESGEGVGHILDASDALKMIKQRRQAKLPKDGAKPSKTRARPDSQSCESLPPSSPVPATKRRTDNFVPTSKSQEDFCYVDSDCEEPPPLQLPEANDEGRKLIYVFRGQRYPTDVDLTDIPWAAGDSEDEEELQQIRYKPRVLWPDHPEDVNRRIKLRDTQANAQLL